MHSPSLQQADRVGPPTPGQQVRVWAPGAPGPAGPRGVGQGPFWLQQDTPPPGSNPAGGGDSVLRGQVARDRECLSMWVWACPAQRSDKAACTVSALVTETPKGEAFEKAAWLRPSGRAAPPRCPRALSARADGCPGASLDIWTLRPLASQTLGGGAVSCLQSPTHLPPWAPREDNGPRSPLLPAFASPGVTASQRALSAPTLSPARTASADPGL